MEPTIPKTVLDSLEAYKTSSTWNVVMTCGLAGSGKTTLAKEIASHFSSYNRISIDEIVHEHHGIYGTDYAPSNILYQSYLEEADEHYLVRFRDLLAEKQNIILERSFYAKKDREVYSAMAQDAGAKVVLVVLRATNKESLWQRICTRSEEPKTADSAFDIERDTFEMYWDGFENPHEDEDAIIVEASV